MLTRRLPWTIVFSGITAIIFGMAGAALAQNVVKVNGYEIDVKGQEPTVPKELEPVDGEGRLKKWIVQFTGPIHETDKRQLVDQGCRIGDYLPEFAFLVTMDNKTGERKCVLMS